MSAALAVSASIWPIPFLITGGEGAGFTDFFLSMALFALAAPLAGVILREIARTHRLSRRAFVGLFLLVTSPMLCFQAVILPVSAPSLFLPRSMLLDQPHYLVRIAAALCGTSIYLALSLVFYYLVGRLRHVPAIVMLVFVFLVLMIAQVTRL